MKKIAFFIIIVILSFIFSIFFIGDNMKLKKIEKKSTDQEWEGILYYHSKLKNRYLEYQAKNPSLSKEDIITHVNIGIDQPYYTNTKETPYLNTNYILSNKYLYMSEDYVPSHLEPIDSNYSSGNRLLVCEAKDAFEKMAKDALSEGYTIRAMSAYRSYQYQKDLYERYVKQDGVEKADTYSARPGFSEHQTGLVVDVDNKSTNYTNFDTTKEYIWMKENASNYGFILRYPEGKKHITGYTYESWHYRYVGIEIAKKMKELNLTFDEYYARYIENNNPLV